MTTFAMLLAIDPLTNELFSIGEAESALSVPNIIFELAFMDFATIHVVFGKAINLVVLPFAIPNEGSIFFL